MLVPEGPIVTELIGWPLRFALPQSRIPLPDVERASVQFAVPVTSTGSRNLSFGIAPA